LNRNSRDEANAESAQALQTPLLAGDVGGLLDRRVVEVRHGVVPEDPPDDRGPLEQVALVEAQGVEA
jgi:hypothetical protein